MSPHFYCFHKRLVSSLVLANRCQHFTYEKWHYWGREVVKGGWRIIGTECKSSRNPTSSHLCMHHGTGRKEMQQGGFMCTQAPLIRWNSQRGSWFWSLLQPAANWLLKKGLYVISMSPIWQAQMSPVHGHLWSGNSPPACSARSVSLKGTEQKVSFSQSPNCPHPALGLVQINAS